MTKPLRVLLVEDSPDDAELVVMQLEREHYTILWERVDTAHDMRVALRARQWDVIISDYAMPTFDAIAALAVMKEAELDLPFIIVSGVIGEETAVAAMKAGAHDYLLKKHMARLVPAIEREIREAQVRAQFKQARAEIETLAFFDPLTGLPNTTQFLRQLQSWLNRERTTDLFGVVYLDIDRYKNVKYGFGHHKSEQFLIMVAQRLRTVVHSEDHLARVGEDGFALLLTRLPDRETLHQRVAQIHQRMGDIFQLGLSRIHTSIAIGVADSTLNYPHPADLLRAADTAMHSARQRGLPTVFFSAQMQVEELRRLRLEADLQRAISAAELQLYYQPIVSLRDQRVVGFEALIRWQHPTQGWLAPNLFIPIAEQTGLILPLGEWIMLAACQQIQQWQQTLTDYFPLAIAINLSGIQLDHADLAATIRKAYHRCDQQGVQLGVEITESVLMSNTAKTFAVLEELRQLGVKISVDDFGTGYSSLAYLHQFPIDTLKVDRSFIQSIADDSRGFKVASTIIALAHTLGLEVVAEGIEAAAQFEVLHSLACDCGQGYWFSHPLPPAQVHTWLEHFSRQRQKTKV